MIVIKNITTKDLELFEQVVSDANRIRAKKIKDTDDLIKTNPLMIETVNQSKGWYSVVVSTKNTPYKHIEPVGQVEAGISKRLNKQGVNATR